MRSWVRWTVSFSFLWPSTGLASGSGRIGVTTPFGSSSFVCSEIRSGMSDAKGSFLMVLLLAVCDLAIDDALPRFLGDDFSRELPVVLGPVALRVIGRDGPALRGAFGEPDVLANLRPEDQLGEFQ